MATNLLLISLLIIMASCYHKLLPNEELTLLENVESGDYNIYVIQFYDGEDEEKVKLRT